MNISFHKYEGAGNDFIILDDRRNRLSLSTAQIARLCDRRFGIGADGLMLLRDCAGADFRMVYFNADGYESTFCGNGGRCIAHYASHILEIAGPAMDFLASDGGHHAEILPDGRVALTMLPVKQIRFFEDHYILDTGSPHYVQLVENVQALDVFAEGKRIRHQPEFEPKGINVNFLQRGTPGNFLRTYERGVENETFACGTGVTAAAIVLSGQQTGHFEIPVTSKAGHYFKVSYDKKSPGAAENIILTGPVHLVFEGNVTVPHH
ncbi:MAG TPA: diaminopimelate epimerase [Edaphocola sp.]|nr:diaminopimelate epimerase [Edaphocola sp.]